MSPFTSVTVHAMSRFLRIIPCLALLVVPVASRAQGVMTSPGVSAPDLEGWHVTLTPYLWMPGLRGEISTIAGLPPVKVDKTFSQVMEDIDAAFMFLGQVRKGRYGGLLGYIYTNNATTGAFPGTTYSTLDTKTENSTFDVAGFYRGWTWENTFVDAVLGARIWNARLDLDLGQGTEPARSESENQTWVDPLIGGKASYAAGDTGWFVNGFLFVGGIGAGSDFMWDVDANVGFQWVPSFMTLVGYRYLDVKYKNEGFVYDVAQAGLVLAVSLQF